MKTGLIIFLGLLGFNCTTLFPAMASASLEKVYQELRESRPSEIEKTTLLVADILDSEMRFYSNKDNPAIQELIDKAFDDILQTDTGSEFCHQTTSDPQKISSQLGVSQGKAVELSSLCEKKHPRLKDSRDQRTSFKPGTKTYYFVFNVPENFPFQSWTSMTNETYIVFDHKLSSEELYARLIHEYVIANDAKLMLSSETGLDLERTYGGKIKNAGSGDDKIQNIRNIFGIMPFPLLKFSFASLRAMTLEYWILNDLFPDWLKEHKVSNEEVFTLLSKGNTIEALRLTMESLVDYQDYLLPMEYVIVPKNERRLLAGHLYINRDKIPVALKAFQDSKMTIVTNRMKFKVVDWMALPLIGSHSTFYSRGPRPRVGGGWAQDQKDLKRPEGLSDEAWEQMKKVLQTKNSSTSRRVDVLLDPPQKGPKSLEQIIEEQTRTQQGRN